MLKQIYKFLSMVLISNLLLSAAAFAKTATVFGVQHKKSHKEKVEQNKEAPEQNTVQSPKKPDQNTNDNPCNNQGQSFKPLPYDGPQYTTKYGIYLLDDMYNSYPQTEPK